MGLLLGFSLLHLLYLRLAQPLRLYQDQFCESWSVCMDAATLLCSFFCGPSSALNPRYTSLQHKAFAGYLVRPTSNKQDNCASHVKTITRYSRVVLSVLECRPFLGGAMICLQLAALTAYVTTAVARCWVVLRDANWPQGFLWWDPPAEQRLATAVFLLMRLQKQVTPHAPLACSLISKLVALL